MRRAFLLPLLLLLLGAVPPAAGEPVDDPARMVLSGASPDGSEPRDVFAHLTVADPGSPSWWETTGGRLSREIDAGDLEGQLDFVTRAYAEKNRPREAVKLYAEIAEIAGEGSRLRLKALYEIGYLYEVQLRDVQRALATYASCSTFPLGDPAEARQNRIAAGFGALRVLQATEPSKALPLLRLFAHDLVLAGDVYGDLILPEVFLRLADLSRAGDKDAARRAYQAAAVTAERIPETMPPNFRAPGSAARIALRTLDREAIDFARVPDGEFEGRALGYNAPVAVEAAFRDGRLVDLRVTEFGDKRPLDAYRVLPRRLVETQRLDVDGVSGATVTSRAILSATVGAVLNAEPSGTGAEENAP